MEMVLVKTKTAIIFFFLLFSLTMAYTIILTKDIDDTLKNISMSSIVYDRHGQLIGNLFDHRKTWVSLDKIHPHLQKAVVAIEDARFYNHFGIDLKGIARAAVRNLIPGGPMEGGSTITQQLAKIALLSSERTLIRKFKDITCALGIEQSFTKNQILELYLNSIYLAHGNLGVEAAAQYYFGKSAATLTLDQAALIAGLIRSPENYSPFKDPELAVARRNLVLKKMYEQGYITAAEYKKASAKPLNVTKREKTSIAGAYFLDYVKESLIAEHGFTEEELRLGGFRIYTTLDITAQKAAEEVTTKLPGFTRKDSPQIALLTLDPRTGEILAMVGGRNYTDTQLNRSVKSYRQPGSAIKPFVYAAALDGGFTAASLLEDKPLVITLANGVEWRPENNDHDYRGKITLRRALSESVNTVAVQLVQTLGVENVAAKIEAMGINSLVKSGSNNDLNLAPLALGGLTKGVTPLELTAAYSAFANGGKYSKPYAVQKIVDNKGKTIKQFHPVQKETLSPQTAYIITMLLQDAVEKGTGQQAKLPDRPVAGKTGTTSNYTNAWFIGYTPDLITTVWLGNDRQEEPMVYQKGRIGSATASALWKQYMAKVTKNRPVLDFIQPPGIVWANVDPETGRTVSGWFTRNSYKEVFTEDNVPRGPIQKIWHWLFSPPKKEEKEEEATFPGETGTTGDSSVISGKSKVRKY